VARHEKRRGPGAPLPPTLVYIAGLLFAWRLGNKTPLRVDDVGPGLLQVVIGWLAISVGMALFAWGMSTFARARTGIMLQHAAARVVRDGPYRWSRNPQYVGFTLSYIGVGLVMNNAWALLFLPLVILILEAAVIAREERYMRSTFGPTYDDYCRRVRRWL
jgi:protein-S-isoprenylcysteine O-methyltransferase Ste14